MSGSLSVTLLLSIHAMPKSYAFLLRPCYSYIAQQRDSWTPLYSDYLDTRTLRFLDTLLKRKNLIGGDEDGSASSTQNPKIRYTKYDIRYNKTIKQSNN